MITGNLEYLMCSLPNLSFQNGEAMRSQVASVFKAYKSSSDVSNDLISILDHEAEKFLNTNAFQIFQQIDLLTLYSTVFLNSNIKVLSTFSRFTYAIKEEIRAIRIARKNNEKQSKSKYQLINISATNPLEAELQLINLQWNKLEALSIEHYADLSALIIYKLKLQLLIRWWSFDTDKGYVLFKEIINQD